MSVKVDFDLTSLGHKMDVSENAFGFLRESHDVLDNPELANQRIEEDGYLYIPGFFGREEILEARASVAAIFAKQGVLDPQYPEIDAIHNKASFLHGFSPDLVQNLPAIRKIVFGPQLLDFYRQIFNHEVLHFSFIWFRTPTRGRGTPPHCDLVYMGRGTPKLLTCWIPYGDVPLEVGGLMVLEKSHLKSEVIKNYLELDVDSYCENIPSQVQKVAKDGRMLRDGWLTKNPVSLRAKLGGRWLTAEYRAGDLITFPMNMIHASLDNQTDRIRMSSDTRYQRSDEPADNRWIGENPVGHSKAGKLGRVC